MRLILIFVVLVGAAFNAQAFHVLPCPAGSQTAGAVLECSPSKPNSAYWVRVTRVIDGDTIVGDIDLGFGLTKRGIKFRFASINAFEKRGLERPKGLEAKAAVESVILAADSWVVVRAYDSPKGGFLSDSFGRYVVDIMLFNVEISDGALLDGIRLNDWLVSKGHARYAEY